MKTKLFFIVFLILCCCWTPALGQSPHIRQSAITSGAGRTVGAHQSVGETFGQSVVGVSGSAHYMQGAGFWWDGPTLNQLFNTGVYDVSADWNMVSIPRNVADRRKSSVYPGATSVAFNYCAGYKNVDTLCIGQGYWVKFPASQLVTMVGSPIVQETVAVAKYWNMIGTITTPMPISSIVTDPPGLIISPFFWYSGHYESETVLKPGRAYWVKTSDAGIIILNSGPVVAGAPAENTTDVSGLNELSFHRETGGGTSSPVKLYLGAIEHDVQRTLERSEMPPKPPAGGFDVRFASNRSIEACRGGSGEPEEYPLLVQAGSAPVTLTWSMKNQTTLYTLIEKKGEKALAAHRLAENGSVQLTPEKGREYVVRVEQRPTAYALFQNYPNPFNPVTTIRYQLPFASHVTLTLFNMLGQQVRTLVDAMQESGHQSYEVDGSGLSSGVYFYRLDAQSGSRRFSDVKKMSLVK